MRIRCDFLPVFYGAIYITLRAVLSERAIYTDASHPVCPYKIPWGECESRASHSPESLIFPEFPISKHKPRASHRPKSQSFRNLSSNEVRFKFREREKVEIIVPTKPEANLTFDGGLADVELYILRYARSASSKSAACVYGAHICARLRYHLKNYIKSAPCKAKVCTLNEVLRFKVLLVLFFRKECVADASAASGSRKPP